MPYFILDSSGYIWKNYSISLFAASLLVGRLLFQQWHPYFDVLRLRQQLWYNQCSALDWVSFAAIPAANCNPCESRGHLFLFLVASLVPSESLECSGWSVSTYLLSEWASDIREWHFQLMSLALNNKMLYARMNLTFESNNRAFFIHPFIYPHVIKRI